MFTQETSPRPSGRFPSVEIESETRTNFLSTTNNPLYDYFLSNLDQPGFEDLSSNVAMNFLALNYGLYFYNEVSNNALYSFDELPKFNVVNDDRFPTSTAFTVAGSDITNVNVQGSDFRKQYIHNPNDNLAIVIEPEIVFPTFIVNILAGIEEASHIHLEKLHKKHGANSNSQNDNNTPHFKEVATLIEYQSQRWREFAAVTVQWMYIQYYLSGDYPTEAAKFEKYYKQVQIARKQWEVQSHLRQ